jgi:hypothetical protein
VGAALAKRWVGAVAAAEGSGADATALRSAACRLTSVPSDLEADALPAADGDVVSVDEQLAAVRCWRWNARQGFATLEHGGPAGRQHEPCGVPGSDED